MVSASCEGNLCSNRYPKLCMPWASLYCVFHVTFWGSQLAASNEWEEVHLTPAGWVDGSFRLDSGTKEEIAVPEDAVLTIRRRVYVASVFSAPDISHDETAHTADTARIAELRKRFGEPIFGV